MIMITVMIPILKHPNDCKQDGEKYNFAVNNEYFTLGRTHDKANYTTGDWLIILQ